MNDSLTFGDRRSYYNNFAAHLLNAYSPNMLHPELSHRWSDGDWCNLIDMVASFGFSTLQFWLVPRLFCRQGLQDPYGQAFVRQMRHVIECAHSRGLQVDMLCSLATVGSDWQTYCPSVAEEWAELVFLWDAWTRMLSGVDIVSIFPGDPGACSRNGCTAITFIDKSIEVAVLVKQNLPTAEITLHTWGPPFFGWGNIVGPTGWQGEFVQEYQHTAWAFSRVRAERAMNHLLERLPDFPDPTSVAINLGFNPDGKPESEANAIPWANEIAKTHRIQTWDFSLTEGENAIVPHYRFQRLFAQRRRERAAAPYSGGICFTMTPLLNQLSLYQSAQSFIDPDADYELLAMGFYDRLFGPAGADLVPFLPLFEVVPDWGNYSLIEMSRQAYHRAMCRLAVCLHDLKTAVRKDVPFHPSVESYRQELLFFADLLAGLSGSAPDYDALRQRYWNRVYAIYDQLPDHVDPRPQRATDNLIKWFTLWD